MFDWFYDVKKDSGNLANKDRKALLNEIDRLKSEYQSISNNTTDIDESLRRFELALEIVRMADALGVVIGNTYSGEVISDYQHAVRQIVNRLWNIRLSRKLKYHNEHKALQIQANSLFNWKESNHERWWNDDQQAHDYELDRADIERIVSEINGVL